jgi:hypothetical protein
LNQDALHPALVTNPSVYDLTPDALERADRAGVGQEPMST